MFSFIFRPAASQLRRASSLQRFFCCQLQMPPSVARQRRGRGFSTQTPSSSSETAVDLKKVITGWSVDSYGGLHFDCTAAAADVDAKDKCSRLSTLSIDQFERLVEQQIAQCRRPLSFAEEVDEVEEVRALWFRVSKAHVRLIAPLVKASIADCHLFCIGQRCLGLSVWLEN